MEIYTYCSYRSSHYGYHYASFESTSTGVIHSELPVESFASHKIPSEFVDWCQRKSGWQLIVKKIPGENKYWLMAGQLEKSREYKKKQDWNQNHHDFDSNSYDSDWYITLGFYGSISEIKPIAQKFLISYINGFCDLFDELEKTIHKTVDAKRYEINASSFNGVFSDISSSSKTTSVSNDRTIFSYVINKLNKLKTHPHIRLSNDKRICEGELPDNNDKRKNVKKCISELDSMENFSEDFLLLIAYDYFKIDSKVNIHIDYEYLLGQRM